MALDVEAVDRFFAQHGGKVEKFKFQPAENESEKIFSAGRGEGEDRFRISLLIGSGEEQAYRDHYLALGASEYSATA